MSNNLPFPSLTAAQDFAFKQALAQAGFTTEDLLMFCDVDVTSCLYSVMREDRIEVLHKYISEVNFSTHAFTCMERVGIKYLWQLAECNEERMLKTKGVGTKTLAEMKYMLSGYFLQLGMKLPSDDHRHFPWNRA